MSKIPQRALFQHPSIYDSSKFRIKQIIQRPSNTKASGGFTSGESVQWNLGGSPNQFIVPESAYMTFYSRVVGGVNGQVPGGNGFNLSNPYGLPRVDFGLNMFDQVNVGLDSSRSITNMVGWSLISQVLNARVAAAADACSEDVRDIVYGDEQLKFDLTRCVSMGPSSLCGFLSNIKRSQSFSGVYRSGANQVVSVNGGLTYRIPLALMHGLFDSQASSWLPIGLLAQSSSNGVNISVRIAQLANIVSDSEDRPQSISEGGETTPQIAGQSLANCSYFIYEPVIVYRVVEILDESILNVLRMSFNGQNVESLNMGGQVINIPRLLNIHYRGYEYFQRPFLQGASVQSFTISTTQPSVKGIMIRLQKQSQDGAILPITKAVDPNIIVTRFQVRIGNSVYPLTPVSQDNTSSWVNVTLTTAQATQAAVTAAAAAAAGSSGGQSTALISALQEDGLSLFAPWQQSGTLNNVVDLSFTNPNLVGPNVCGDEPNRSIRPLIVSFENHASTEKLEGESAATGIDMRGIGSMQVDLGFLEVDGINLVAPTENYNVNVCLCYDGVLSVKRGAVDPDYQYATY